MYKFEKGQKLSAVSICNSDCVFTGTVISRTAKMVKVQLSDGEIVNKKIHVYEDSEYMYPHGQYSMAATFSAKDAA